MTDEQRSTIKSLVNQINEIAEHQQALNNGYTDNGTIVAADEPILLDFIDHTEPPYVAVYDCLTQSGIESIDYPLTQLPSILLLVKENIDLLDAVDIVKVREALRLLEHTTLDKEETRITKDGLIALQHIKRNLIGRIQPVKREPIVEL